MTWIRSHRDLPPIATSHVLETEPEMPERVLCRVPYTYIDTQPPDRPQRTACHRPSSIRPFDPTATPVPLPAWNWHSTRPPYTSTFQLPPAVPPCPFWTTLL